MRNNTKRKPVETPKEGPVHPATAAEVEVALDKALEESFPAGDPVSISIADIQHRPTLKLPKHKTTK